MATATREELREATGAESPARSITWLNSMFYGEPGVGKTHLLGTAADHPLTSPVMILDIDGGITTLRKRPEIDVVQIRSVKKIIETYKKLYNAIPTDPEEKFPYGTVGIDTFSELHELDLVEIMAGFAKINDKIDKDVPDQRGYGKGRNHMRDILRAFRDLPCNLVVTAHSYQDRDNNMRLMTFPKFAGKLRVDLPGFLDIVGYYKMEDDNRVMQFMKTETCIAKDRTGAFDPIEVNPTIPILWDKLQATNNGKEPK